MALHHVQVTNRGHNAQRPRDLSIRSAAHAQTIRPSHNLSKFRGQNHLGKWARSSYVLDGITNRILEAAQTVVE